MEKISLISADKVREFIDRKRRYYSNPVAYQYGYYTSVESQLASYLLTEMEKELLGN